MRIALAQLNPTSGDIDSNTAKVIDAIAEASARGADLLVTPEMAIPGYCIGDLVEDAGFLAANERAMARVAAAATSLTVIVGFIDHDPTARNDSGTILKHNAAAVVSGGRVLQRAHKSLLPNYRYFDDKRYFVPARARETVDVVLGSQPDAAGRLDLRGHVGRVLCRQAVAGTGGEGRGPPRQHQRLALLPRQAARARRAHPPAHRAAREALRLREHVGRGRQRQEHHPVRRREPGLRRRRPPAGDGPAVRRGAAGRRSGSRGARRSRFAPSIASARCTTRS